MWQLLHHLIGFRDLGCEIHYVEDHGSWVYDPMKQTPVRDPAPNLKILDDVLKRFGFAGCWTFYNKERDEYVGSSRERYHQLFAEADAVINLCGASHSREAHLAAPCRVYLQTDPGQLQVELSRREALASELSRTYNFFFTYAANIGQADCRLPTGPLKWHPTVPPVHLEQWGSRGRMAEPGAPFTTVGTWHNRGGDVEISNETYFWSKDVNFRKLLDVARRSGQQIELATDLDSGPDYETARAGGFTFRPVVPLSLDLDSYRDYIERSRGEFTAAKDIYVRTRSGWFSDRTVCYLAAGRPAVTQRTGFEKFIPEGVGLLGFDTADEAVDAIKRINADYSRHCRMAREIAAEYFDGAKVLTRILELIGL